MNPVTTTPQDVVNPLAHLLSQGAMIPTPAPGYSLTLTHKRLRFGDDEESEVHLRMEDNVDEGNVSDGAAMNRMSKRQLRAALRKTQSKVKELESINATLLKELDIARQTRRDAFLTSLRSLDPTSNEFIQEWMDNQHNILQYIRRVAPRLIRSRPFDHLRPLTRQDYLTNYRGVQATLRPIVQEGRSFLRNVTGSTTANLLSVAKALCDSDPYLSYPTELITALTAIQRLGADGKTTRIINRPVYILESFNGLTADTMAEAARNFATAAELVRLDLGDLPQTGVWMGTLQVAGAWAVWVYRGVAEGTATLQVYDEHNEWSDHEVKLAFIDPVAQLLSGTEIERTEAAEVVGMSQVKLFEHASLESSGPLSVRIIQALIHSPDPILTSKRLLIDDPIASFDEIVLALRDLHFRCVLDATNMGTEVFDYVRSNVV